MNHRLASAFTLTILFCCFIASLAVAENPAQQTIPGQRRLVTRHAVVNFSELAAPQPAVAARGAEQTKLVRRPMPPPADRQAQIAGLRKQFPQRAPVTLKQAAPVVLAAPVMSLPSPPVVTSFNALPDNDTAIPPDTMGAVGPNHVMTTLNSQVRVQNRSGTAFSTVSLNDFWSSLGPFDVFDPRLTYDRFNNRWIFAAVADAELPTAAVLVGVSQTSNPTGNWNLYSVDADPSDLVWPDFTNLGFNKDWIVVSVNLFPIRGNFSSVAYLVFEKADLYANGPGALTVLEDTSGLAFAVAPATTLDNSLATMYLVEDWDNLNGQLRISTITGAIGSEALTIGADFANAPDTWEFAPFSDNFAPQRDSKKNIDTGDSRILSCVYRDGSLWLAHTVFLPVNAPTRSAVQWWQIEPDGSIEQFGRIEDFTGNKFYAFPSLAVNASNDVLIGYTRFSATQYASGNYSFRFADDPPNTMRKDSLLKAGEGPYYSASSDKINRWGDYSATVVDPVNDLSMWTIQEYAAAPVGNLSRWGTWWGRVDPDLSALKLGITQPADEMSYPPAGNVIITASLLNTNVSLTKVEFFADTMKIGEKTAAPYTLTWQSPADGFYALTARGTQMAGGQTTSTVVFVTVGDTKSPLGTWETKLAGFDKGNAFVTFHDDFTYTGYGIGATTFGLFTIEGDWGFDSRHQTVGDFTETIDSVELLGGDLVAKTTSGKSLKATVTPNTFVKPLKLKGTPEAPTPDLTGSWAATVKAAGQILSETYTLTASATLPNVFDFVGAGDGYALTGTVVVTSRGLMGMTTTNGVLRALTGKVNTLKGSAKLKGVDDQGNKISVSATLP